MLINIVRLGYDAVFGCCGKRIMHIPCNVGDNE